MSSQVVTFYKDKEKTNALYPRTKVSAISDGDGVALSELLGLQMDLLWTNASPTSNFSEQTINLDLTNYKLLFVITLHANNASYTSNFIINLNKLGVDQVMTYANYSSMKHNLRSIIISNDKKSLLIRDGYNSKTYGTYEVNNTIAIPYQIYGVK